MTHKFEVQHIERLLSADRYRDIQPEALLRSAGLKEGGVFADVGCGPGFFTVAGAAIVGPLGRVWAIDTQEEMLSELKKRGLPACVTPVKSGENAIPVDSDTVDLALLAYVLHEAEQKEGFLKEVGRIIKKGGLLVVMDWKKIKEEKGPPFEERLTEAEVVRLLKEAGFKDVRQESMNPSHYKATAVKRP